MDPLRWRRLATAFEEVRAASGVERERRLALACQREPELAAELTAMLAADGRAGVGLEPPPWPDEAHSPSGVDAWIGREIGGFVVEAFLARGGMGRVYRARQIAPARAVAFKTLATNAPDFAQRLAFEAGLLARLDHPHIARVIAAGSNAPGEAWIAMELVEEAQRLDAYAAAQGLSGRERINLLIQAARALEHAHGRGVLHRDLKPSNLLVGSDGRLRVIDFGVAAARSGPQGRSLGMEDSADDVIGTLGYLAPELLAGGIGAADVHSDIYALGVVAYELLLGQRLGTAVDLIESLSLASETSAAAPAPAREFLPELRWLLARALAPRPEQRYGSMSALARDLEALLSGELLAVAPRAWSYRLRHRLRNRPWQSLGVAFVGLLLVSGASALGIGYARALDAARREHQAAAREREALKSAEASGAALLLAKTRAEALAGARRSVGEFFVGMFASLSPYTQGREVEVRDLLEQSFAELSAGSASPDTNLALLSYAHGLGFQGLGDHDRAEAAFAQAEAEWARAGLESVDEGQRARLPMHLAELAAQRGDCLRAEALYDLSIEQFQRLGRGAALFMARVSRARWRAGRGELAAALEDVEAAIALGTDAPPAGLNENPTERQQQLLLLSLEGSVLQHRLGRLSGPELLAEAQTRLAELEHLGALRPAVRLPLASLCGQLADLALQFDQKQLAWACSRLELELRLACERWQSWPVVAALDRTLLLALELGATAEIATNRSVLAQALLEFDPGWPLRPLETLLQACQGGTEQELSLLVLDVCRPLWLSWQPLLPLDHPARCLLGKRLGLALMAQSQWAVANDVFISLSAALEGPDDWAARAALGLRRARCLAELLELEAAAALFDAFSNPWPSELGAPGSTEQLEYQLVQARVLFGLDRLERGQALAEQGLASAREALRSARWPVVRFQHLADDFRQLLARYELKQH